MNKYETLFIIKPDLTDEEVEAVLDRLKTRIERVEGKLASIDYWGRRRLAYPIRYRGEKLFKGFYVLITYVGDGTAVEEVERNIKILDPTFRYLTVKLEDEVDPSAITEVEVSKKEEEEEYVESERREYGDDGDRDEGYEEAGDEDEEDDASESEENEDAEPSPPESEEKEETSADENDENGDETSEGDKE